MASTGTRGAEAVLVALKAMGVERIYASPGSDWAPLWEALAGPPAERNFPSYISSRHEETAVGMAIGYAKATGKLAAVMLHTTVGALHAAITGANRTRIITLALGAHFPAIFSTRDFAQLGGLISYGPSFEAMFRRAAEFTDKILRGAKPSEIPVEQPTKFELVVNLTTAQAIDLIVPPAILARADEVIE